VVILLVIAVLLVVGAIRLVAEVGRRADAEPSDTAIDSGAPDEDLIEAVVADAADEPIP
jgi:hypothetical protein